MCTECEDTRKETQLSNLLEKPVYFLELYRQKIREDGTAVMNRKRKFLKGFTFFEAINEAKKYMMTGYYDDVKLYQMRGVVDSVPLWQRD